MSRSRDIANIGDDVASGTVLTSSGAIDVNASAPADSVAIDASGNVGIGTTSPSGLLHLSANTDDTTLPSMVFQDSGTASTRLGFITNKDGDLIMSATSGITSQKATISLRDDASMRLYTNGSERMRITSGGELLVGKTSFTEQNDGFQTNGDITACSGNGTSALRIHRNGDDGGLVSFNQAGSNEGSISVSGTTVSYNGGHLSRWSQLADNTRDESILKGTVMSNLDQMAEWTNEGVTEDNEQLNCMKVSDVEGDANVAGAFVNWDNDDDIYTNDMNIAMTGDFVIRIAQGTTVQRGDLLMSAGDGTAKPQGDDIVRSKTIAKVTSTHVSHTYDDGSYLVPCVLMAC